MGITEVNYSSNNALLWLKFDRHPVKSEKADTDKKYKKVKIIDMPRRYADLMTQLSWNGGTDLTV